MRPHVRPPSSWPANSAFFLFKAIGRIARSTVSGFRPRRSDAEGDNLSGGGSRGPLAHTVAKLRRILNIMIRRRGKDQRIGILGGFGGLRTKRSSVVRYDM